MTGGISGFAFAVLMLEITTFESLPLEVLRGLRTLLGAAEKWVCFCTFAPHSPASSVFAGESGWRAGRSFIRRPACHSGGGAWPDATTSSMPRLFWNPRFSSTIWLRFVISLSRRDARSGFAFALLLPTPPRLPSSRGSPDGALVALSSGDRRAIRVGVPGRAPRPPRCRGFSGTHDFPRLFGFVSSFRCHAAMLEVGLFLHFSLMAEATLEVLRVLRTTSHDVRSGFVPAKSHFPRDPPETQNGTPKDAARPL